MNNCFSIYYTSWITSGPKSKFICENIAAKAILFFFGCSEVNSTWLITFELANQRARKVLFTCVVYTNIKYIVASNIWKMANTSISGVFVTGIYGIRDIWSKNYWQGYGILKDPPNGASLLWSSFPSSLPKFFTATNFKDRPTVEGKKFSQMQS